MAREEQIRQEIDYQLAGSFGNYPEGYEEGFIEGAKWADEHPYLREEEQVGMGGLGMVWQKQALIKKACEWLNNELFEDKAEFNSYYDTDVKSKSYDTLDQFIDNFKKAMEA